MKGNVKMILDYFLIAFCFTMKTSGTTFTTNGIVLGVRSVP